MFQRIPRAAQRCFAIRLFCTFLTSLAAMTGSATALPDPAEPEFQRLERLSLHLVNAARAAEGLEALRSDRELSRSAQRHAADMRERRYYAHLSPEGDNALDRFVAVGGNAWLKVTENIAYCSPCGATATAALVQSFHRQWMKSQGHRDNIFDPHITHFGFGVAGGPDGRQFAVQTFAGPGASAPTENGREAERITPEQEQSLALAFVNRERGSRNLSRLAGSQTLSHAARLLLSRQVRGPNEALEGLSAKALYEALAEADRLRWQGLGIIVVGCGGCGIVPTDADIAFFQGQWIESRRNRAQIIEGDFSHFGFAMVADGKGQKLAMAVVAKAK